MISVIIPNYNQQDYLIECLDSVFKQTQQPLEVIVIDDGSTDNSLQIAERYDVKVISQINKGLASARNTGIMNSIGKWVLFLDADDKLLPNCVEKLCAYIMQTDGDIIVPSFKEFGLSDREVILMSNPTLEDFKIGNRLGYCGAIKKEVLLKVGGYNPKMVEGYEDLALWCLLLSKDKKVLTIPEILWMYRIKEQSMYRSITPEIHRKLIAQINKDVPEAQLNF